MFLYCSCASLPCKYLCIVTLRLLIISFGFFVCFKKPSILVFLKTSLAFPRSKYSRSFADLVSVEIDVQDSYKDGLITLTCILGGFALIWGLILIYLIIKGNSVGCASGRAFERSVVRKSNHQDPCEEKLHETDSSTESVLSVPGDENHMDSGIALEDASFSSSLCSSDAASRIESSRSMTDDEASQVTTIDTSPRAEGSRAFRTRIVFFLFACTVLACVPLALAFSFAPMKETVRSFDGGFEVSCFVACPFRDEEGELSLLTAPLSLCSTLWQETNDAVLQSNAALSTIFTASFNAMEILNQTKTEFAAFCPYVNVSTAKRELGVDLVGLSNSISVEYVALQNKVTTNMIEIESILRSIEDSVEVVESTFGRAENVIWLVPGLLLGVSVATAFATFGVILAWKQESSLRFQRLMTYCVLPTLTLLCVLCWILAIGTIVSTAVSTGKSLYASLWILSRRITKWNVKRILMKCI